MKQRLFFFSLLLVGMLIFAYNSKEEEQLMFNQGYFGAVFCYQTYTNVGMIADNWVGKIYKPDQCIELVNEQIKFLTKGKENLNSLSQLNLSSSDRKVLLHMISIVEDLLHKAKALQQLIQSGNKIHQDNYSYYRQQAFNKIQEFIKKD